MLKVYDDWVPMTISAQARVNIRVRFKVMLMFSFCFNCMFKAKVLFGVRDRVGLGLGFAIG